MPLPTTTPHEQRRGSCLSAAFFSYSVTSCPPALIHSAYASVYKAVHAETEVTVAIKQLAVDGADCEVSTDPTRSCTATMFCFGSTVRGYELLVFSMMLPFPTGYVRSIAVGGFMSTSFI
jgi:hypothetical protein